jgi:AsmA protein
MSRTNIIFFSVIVIVVIIVGGAMALLSDPQNYKGEISATFEDQTSMQLEIRGDMNWRYWPPIALAVNDVVVTPKNSDEPLATITSAAFDMRLIPLILGSNTIPVNGISLDGLTVNARVDKSGKANWATEAAESSTEAPAEAETGAPAEPGGSSLGLDIKSIRISDTNISYIDDAAGAEYRITMPSLTMGSLRYDEPTEVRFNVLFEDLIAAMKVETNGNGQIVFGQSFGTITMQDLSINEQQGRLQDQRYHGQQQHQRFCGR